MTWHEFSELLFGRRKLADGQIYDKRDEIGFDDRVGS